MRLRAVSQLNPSVAAVLGTLGLSVGLAAACDVSDDPSCTSGAEGCACVDNACLGSTLTCNAENVCVPKAGAAGDPDAQDDEDDVDEDDGDDGQDEGEDEDTTTTGGADPGDGGEGHEDGPEIVSLNVESAGIGPSTGSVRIIAEVTDPDGADDIFAGTVLGPDDQVLAPFGRLSHDTFALDLPWATLASAGLDLGLEVELTVEFSDAFGHTTTSVMPMVVCKSSEGFCTSQCVNLRDNPNHCGQCGNACAAGESCYYDSCYDDYYYYAEAEPEPGDDEGDLAASATPIPIDGVSLFFSDAQPRSTDLPDVHAYALGR